MRRSSPRVRPRSPWSVIAAGSWLVLWVVGVGAIEDKPWFGLLLRIGWGVVGLLVFQLLWNFDRLREAWQTDRARLDR